MPQASPGDSAISVAYDNSGSGRRVSLDAEPAPATGIAALLDRVAYPKRLLRGLDDLSPEELHRRLETAQPVAVGLRLTNVCNYDCVYCGTAARRGKDTPATLTTGEYKDVISQAAEVGARTIIFGANGEPLLTRDLPEILTHTASLGLIPIIFSNISAIGNDTLCRRRHGMDGRAFLRIIDDSGASLIISAETLDRERYDTVMGVKAFDGFQEGIRRIREDSTLTRAHSYRSRPLCRLALSSVIMPINFDERHALVEFIHSLNGLAILKPPSLHGSAATNIGRMFTPDQVRGIAGELKDLSDKSATLQILNLACASWTLSFSIDNEGNFMACMTEEFNPFGSGMNIRNVRLGALLQRRSEVLRLGKTICPVKDKFYAKPKN